MELTTATDPINLNRTRLECKGIFPASATALNPIWIEPDWNVKQLYLFAPWLHLLIWIEPDWNVKDNTVAKRHAKKEKFE